MFIPDFEYKHVSAIKILMKNNLSYLNEEISWNEFEVIAHNSNHAVHFVNRTLRNRVKNFMLQTRPQKRVCLLDTDQILDYTYMEEELATMEEFRVKRYNDRFGFSVENPSDSICKEFASH